MKNFFNIPAGLPFSDCLAKGIIQNYSPEEIAVMSVYCPSKRGIRALHDSFLKYTHNNVMMLPSLKALGEDEEELHFDYVSENKINNPILKKRVIHSGIRQLALTKIILEHIRTQKKDISYSEAFALSSKLIDLLNSLQSERIDLKKLKDIDVGHHAKAWQDNVFLLNMITDLWPVFLEHNHLCDPVPYRNAVLETLTSNITSTPPDHPIIIAGSTGSMPASADFMSAVGKIKNGAVVLPGIDLSLEQKDIDVLSEDHPQYGLYHLINHCNISPNDIQDWYSVDNFIRPKHIIRQKLFHEIMRPSGTAESWKTLSERFSHSDLEQALKDFYLIQTPTDHEEAIVIALIMREALEKTEQTVALITPNRILARRVKNELKRWDIIPDDSAGTPLSDLPQGVFLKLLFDVIDQKFSSHALLAFLKHPFVAMGYPAGHIKKNIRIFEDILLRGNGVIYGIDHLKEALEYKIQILKESNHFSHEKLEKHQQVLILIETLKIAFDPFLSLPEYITLKDFMERLSIVIDTMTMIRSDNQTYSYFYKEESGRAMFNFIQEFSDYSDLLTRLTLSSLVGHVREFLAKITIRPSYGFTPGVYIWGTPEARLQQTDIIILGGMNEGCWPIKTDSGIWLSRDMRKDIGLSSPERRIGLSAHDFVQAGCAQKVYTTYAQKSDGCPLIPSRWIIRLENIIKGIFDIKGSNFLELIRKTPYLEWIEQLDNTVNPPFMVTRPMPKPPISKRPLRLSVTDIEKWVRDPYYIYVKYILELKKKKSLEYSQEAADRGTIIHTILYEFLKQTGHKIDHNAYEIMHNIIEEQLLKQSSQKEIIPFWRPRLNKIAYHFIEAERKQQYHRQSKILEKKAELEIPLSTGDIFTLVAQADRIDVTSENSFIVVDYKTSASSAYTLQQMEKGLAPQLPLQSIMVEKGCFHDIQNALTEHAEYVIVSGSYKNPYEVKKSIPNIRSQYKNFSEMSKDIFKGFYEWIERFQNPDTPYISQLMPQFLSYEGDYDHLARVKQWRASEEEI